MAQNFLTDLNDDDFQSENIHVNTKIQPQRIINCLPISFLG